MESIELVEFYLEPVRSELEPVHRGIPGNITQIWTIWDGNLAFRGARKDQNININSGIDRARRVLLGTSEL